MRIALASKSCARVRAPLGSSWTHGGNRRQHGGIAFVGLIVPHLARLIVGPVHRSLLPTAALLGALVLLLSDLLCRNVPAHWNLPLGVVTSVLGAPYFIVLLRRHRRGEELQ